MNLALDPIVFKWIQYRLGILCFQGDLESYKDFLGFKLS